MQTEETTKLADIERMLAELSNRNYTYRIMNTGHHFLDGISFCLNVVAEEMGRYHEKVVRAELQLHQRDPGELLTDYILEHLEKPLPTLPMLARMFHTNERKLKERFRALHNTSIYRYYNKHRLDRAYNLIQRTDTPLQEIAEMCGFPTYHNFSTAFKKLYGMAPKKLRLDGGA